MFKKVLASGVILGTSTFYGYRTYNLHYCPSEHAKKCATGTTNTIDLTKPIMGYCLNKYDKLIQIEVPVEAKSTLDHKVINPETATFKTHDALVIGLESNGSMMYSSGLKEIVNGNNFTIDELVTKEDGSPLDEPIKFYLTPDTANAHSNYPLFGKRTVCINDRYSEIDSVVTIDYGDQVTRYYDNGVVKEEIQYNNKYNKHGKYRSYWPDGKLRETGRYKNNEKVGLWMWKDSANVKINCILYI